jgi:hypothetical protein
VDSAFVLARTTLRAEMQYEERRLKTVRPIATTHAAKGQWAQLWRLASPWQTRSCWSRSRNRIVATEPTQFLQHERLQRNGYDLC